MAILTATEVTVLSNISASATTILNSDLISQARDQVVQICNNEFATDIMVVASATFNVSTITLDSNDWVEFGFADGDEIVIRNSYRNDGYYEVASFSGAVATLATGYSVVQELSGRTIAFSMVSWPQSVKKGAAIMIAYDYDVRPSKTPGLQSYSLGPLNESYTSGEKNEYPDEIIRMLPPRTVGMK